MNDSTRPQTERLSIAGPAGHLEGILETVGGRAAAAPSLLRSRHLDSCPACVAVICHPHPVYGGTMTNKVVHTLAKACLELGVAAIRFNYRGVGASEGAYDEGRGETFDTLAVVRWAKERWPDAKLWLGGFSFGGAVALRATAELDPERLVTVAPAIQRVDVTKVAPPRCPWLIVQGDQDELVNAQEIQTWAQSLARPPELELLPGVDHFFHGRLTDLRNAVVSWARSLEG